MKLTRHMDLLTCTGALDYDEGVDRARLVASLAEALREKNARDVVVRKGSVSFRGGLFRFVTRANILNGFHRGELIVDGARHNVLYRLSIRQLVVFLAFILTILAVLAGASPPAPQMWLICGAIPCFFALGLAIDLARFRRFLRKTIDSVPPAS